MGVQVVIHTAKLKHSLLRTSVPEQGKLPSSRPLPDVTLAALAALVAWISVLLSSSVRGERYKHAAPAGRKIDSKGSAFDLEYILRVQQVDQAGFAGRGQAQFRGLVCRVDCNPHGLPGEGALEGELLRGDVQRAVVAVAQGRLAVAQRGEAADRFMQSGL